MLFDNSIINYTKKHKKKIYILTYLWVSILETTIVLHRLFEYNITDNNVLLFVGRGMAVRYVAVITVVFGQLFGQVFETRPWCDGEKENTPCKVTASGIVM